MNPLEGDPYIGLYVPDGWMQKKMFKEKLLNALPKGFMGDWDKPENNWPIWTYLKYEDYSNGKNFDIKIFQDNIIKYIIKLIKIKDIIDKTIKHVENKQMN